VLSHHKNIRDFWLSGDPIKIYEKFYYISIVTLKKSEKIAEKREINYNILFVY